MNVHKFMNRDMYDMQITLVVFIKIWRVDCTSMFNCFRNIKNFEDLKECLITSIHILKFKMDLPLYAKW